MSGMLLNLCNVWNLAKYLQCLGCGKVYAKSGMLLYLSLHCLGNNLKCQGGGEISAMSVRRQNLCNAWKATEHWNVWQVAKSPLCLESGEIFATPGKMVKSLQGLEGSETFSMTG